MSRIHAAFAVSAAMILLLPLWSCGSKASTPPLPELGVVPDFTLTERSGETVSLAELRGAAWVADFIFTTCLGPCPRVSSQMAQLQKAEVGLEGLRFVTFTVDPETDTPAVLRKYANSFGASPERWLFLTGEKQQIHSLIREGFKLAVDDGQSEGPGGPPTGIITHSTRFVLVDSEARIRAYYDSGEPEFDQKIRGGIEKLLAEEAQGPSSGD